MWYYIYYVTSSNFFVISENALKIAFVDPETVTIRSGHDPSDMLIFAPDWKQPNKINTLINLYSNANVWE